METPPPQGQPFTTRFPVPIAQAPASQPPPAQPVAQQQMQSQQPPQTSSHVVTQAMSPGNRPLRAPVANFAYAERDEPLVSQERAQQQQAVRISGKATAPVSVSSPGTAPVPQPPVTEAMSSRATWQQSDPGSQVAQQPTHFSQPREPRERERAPRLESQLREPPRHADRAPVRLKQESDLANHYETPFGNPQKPQRAVPSRAEPQVVRQQQPEPPRAVAPSLQPFAQAQPVRSLLGESLPSQQQATPDRSIPGMPRSMAASMQDPYPGASAPVLQTPPAPAPPAPSRPSEPKKSSLFDLLNDDPPAPPPRRVADVSSGMGPSATPPPQSMGARPPPLTSATSLRREPEPTGYGYRGQGPPSSIMPSLKPYNTQSPQPHHPSIARPMISTTDSPVAGPDRGGYFPRHEYGQHQVQATNSPQGHHYLSQSQHAQQSPMGYQPPSAFPPYGSAVSQQPHASSPTPAFSAHPPPRDRRDPAQAGRDGPWQQVQSLAPQQQSASAMQHQQGGWPGNPALHQQQPSKPREQPTHAASPWGAQHGAPIKPQVTAAMSSQSAWAQAPQSQQQHHLGLREDRGPSVYGLHEARGPPAGMVSHQHHRSLTGQGQYPPQQDLRRQEPGPLPGQASYARYPSAAERQQAQQRDPRDIPRDPRDPGPARTYTPTPMYDIRSQPPPAQTYRMQDQDHEMHLRDIQARERERDQQQRDAAAAQQYAAQQQRQGGLQPSLRPQDPYDHPERFH